MRLKDLFTVPTGQKITDKYLQRVLIVSICGILLSMSCLAGTTWAWYVVDIRNAGNEINIGEPEIEVNVDGTQVVDGGIELNADSHVVNLVHANEADDLNSRSTLYVTLTLQYGSNKVVTKYTKLDSGTPARQISVNNESGESCKLTWGVSWLQPQGSTAEELTDPVITLASLNAPEGDDEDDKQEETAETTEVTTGPTEPSDETPADDEQTGEKTDDNPGEDTSGEETEDTGSEDAENTTEEDSEEPNGEDSENTDN